jgi:uncharacterized protein YneF (UPF0154 family)
LALDRFQLLSLLGVDKDYFTQNPNLTPEQIDILYQTKGVNKDFLAQYPKLSEEQFMRFFNDKDVNKKYLAQNRNLTPEQIDILYQTKGVNKENLAQYPKLTEEQFMRFFNASSTSVLGVNKDYLAKNRYLTPKQIDLLYYTKGVMKKYLAQYPKLTNEQFMRFFNDKDFDKDYLTHNRNLTPKQIDLLYQTKGASSSNFTANYANLTDEQFMRFFNYEGFNKNRLAQNRNLTPEQIDLLYQTKGGFMGANIDNLARYPKLTDEQFQRIAVQTSAQRNFLAMNPSINPPANKPFVSGIFNWRW